MTLSSDQITSTFQKLLAIINFNSRAIFGFNPTKSMSVVTRNNCLLQTDTFYLDPWSDNLHLDSSDKHLLIYPLYKVWNQSDEKFMIHVPTRFFSANHDIDLVIWYNDLDLLETANHHRWGSLQITQILQIAFFSKIESFIVLF